VRLPNSRDFDEQTRGGSLSAPINNGAAVVSGNQVAGGVTNHCNSIDPKIGKLQGLE